MSNLYEYSGSAWVEIAKNGTNGADSTVPGPAGPAGVVQSVVAGGNISVNSSDPANPIVSVMSMFTYFT